MVTARNKCVDMVGLLAALLLSPLAVLAGKPGAEVYTDVTQSVVGVYSRTPNLLDCAVQTSRTHVRCHHRIPTPTAPGSETPQDGDEMPAAIHFAPYPSPGFATPSAPPLARSSIAVQPSFIRFGNFRS
jgi:hypothetical protein